MKDKKQIFYTVLAIVGIFLFIGLAVTAGLTNARKVQLKAIDDELAETSSMRDANEHIKLLARRKALQDQLK